MSIKPEHPGRQEGDKGTFGDMITNLTPGVKNIQAAYNRRGAADHHMRVAAAKLGSQE